MTTFVRGMALVTVALSGCLMAAGCTSSAASPEKMGMSGEQMATEKMGMQKMGTEMMGKNEMGKEKMSDSK